MEKQNNGRVIGKSTLMLAQMGVLIAIMLIFHLTGIGYLKVGVFSLTIMMVPVLIGAITMGPIAGAVLGAVFGASVLILPETQFFIGINPLGTVAVCVGVRVFVGALCGFLFKWFSRFDRIGSWSYGASGLIAALLNTLLMMTGLALVFGSNAEFNPESTGTIALFIGLIAGVSLNAFVEAAVCMVIGGAVARAVVAYLQKLNY